MDSFELNKVLGALLGTCLFLLAIHLASGAIFATPVPVKPGYVIEVKQEQPSTPSGTAAAPPAATQPIESLLASASAQQGAQTAKQCELCHNLGKGQGAKIGPDLYGVVGRKVASEAGFNYSSALKDSSLAKSGDGIWTFDKLNVWLTNPRADVPGTMMTFAGLPSEKQRANVIVYLNSNSDHPLPLPKAAQSAPAGAGGASASTSTPPPKPQGTSSTVPPAGSSPAPAAPAAPSTPGAAAPAK